jgi:hypothetical protein
MLGLVCTISSSPFTQLRLLYTRGAPCNENQDLSSTRKFHFGCIMTFSEFKIEIRFICDTTITEGMAGLSLVKSTDCVTEFEWRNIGIFDFFLSRSFLLLNVLDVFQLGVESARPMIMENNMESAWERSR